MKQVAWACIAAAIANGKLNCSGWLAAIERAIDSGQPTMTAPIALVQDGRQSPGFLMYDPVYRTTNGNAGYK